VSIGKRVVEIVIKGHDASVAAFKSLQANATESKKKLKDLSDEVPGLGRAVSLLSNPFAAAAAVVASLGVAMVKAYNASVQLGAGFMDMSNRTELSVESLAKWKYIAEQNGASINDFEMSFRKLRQTMADAAAGDEAAIKVFQTLGVSATDNTGKMRDLETVMLEIGQSVRQYGVASEQGAAAQDALGRGSSALVAIIKQTTDALGAQSAEAKALSSNMTTAWAESADAADDAAQRFKFAFDNLKAAVVPAQTWIAEAATALVAGLSGTLDEYLAAEHNKFVQERKASGLAAGEAATAAMYQGIQQGFDKAPSSDNSKALADAIVGDEKALVAKIAERIKADTAAAAQLAIETAAALMVPIPVTVQPVVTVEPIKPDDLYPKVMDLGIDAELNTGQNDERIADILAEGEAHRESTDALRQYNEEQQIALDMSAQLKTGLEQVGASAIAAFLNGQQGTIMFGRMMKQMIIQIIAEAIAKFIVLKGLMFFVGLATGGAGGAAATALAHGGTVPGSPGGVGLANGGSVPRLARGGTIPRAAYGYSVPDGPRGMDSRLIAAMPGEEVINRHLSQRLDRMVSAYEYGAAVSPMSVSNSGGRGSIVMQFNVGRPVSVIDGLAYGRTAVEASRKYQEAAL
jgi:hypothetical protein